MPRYSEKVRQLYAEVTRLRRGGRPVLPDDLDAPVFGKTVTRYAWGPDYPSFQASTKVTELYQVMGTAQRDRLAMTLVEPDLFEVLFDGLLMGGMELQDNALSEQLWLVRHRSPNVPSLAPFDWRRLKNDQAWTRVKHVVWPNVMP